MQGTKWVDSLFSCLSAGHLVDCAKAAGANLLLELISGLEVSPVPELAELCCQQSGSSLETCHVSAYPNSLRGAVLAEAEQATDLAGNRLILWFFRSDVVLGDIPVECVIRHKRA